MRGPGVIHPALVWDRDAVILADAGLPGQLPEFREAADKAGAPFDKIGKVIVTHHDIDHIGGLPGILSELPQKVEVIAHEEEIPYIQGGRRPIKMTPEAMAQLKAQLAALPEDRRKAFLAVFENPPKAKVTGR